MAAGRIFGPGTARPWKEQCPANNSFLFLTIENLINIRKSKLEGIVNEESKREV